MRYARRCWQDGRDQHPDVQEALHIRLAMILGGGYPAQKRHIPEEMRQEVFARDGGRCRICGAPGTDIDHIHGSSSTLENLQLLCRRCHNEKTKASFIQITPETHPEQYAKVEELHFRIYVPEPTRLSDSEMWTDIWRKVQAERRRVVRELGEAVEELPREFSAPHPALEEVSETVDFEDLSDGEQAENLALWEGGGDPAWGAEMFGLDLSCDDSRGEGDE